MSNLVQTSPINIKVGDTVRYEVKDLNDTIQYSGTVVGICDYQAAKAYADVAAIHQAMLSADPTLDDSDLLRYIIVECYDNVRRPVGFQTDGKNSWFKDNKLELIEVGSEFRIKLFNASSTEANVAIRILRENGYTCKLLSE